MSVDWQFNGNAINNTVLNVSFAVHELQFALQSLDTNEKLLVYCFVKQQTEEKIS